MSRCFPPCLRMAGGQNSQKIRDFVVIIHKSPPIVKSRASGGYRRGVAPVQIAQNCRCRPSPCAGILSRWPPSCSRPRCCTRRCSRCRYSVRCSSSAVPLAPSACPCCCNGTRSAEPICISANCAAAGAQFFPASGRCPGEHRRTGGTKESPAHLHVPAICAFGPEKPRTAH